MSMKSKAQRKKLWKINPKIAQEFEDETPKGTKLPEYVKQPKKKVKKHGEKK